MAMGIIVAILLSIIVGSIVTGVALLVLSSVQQATYRSSENIDDPEIKSQTQNLINGTSEKAETSIHIIDDLPNLPRESN